MGGEGGRQDANQDWRHPSEEAQETIVPAKYARLYPRHGLSMLYIAIETSLTTRDSLNERFPQPRPETTTHIVFMARPGGGSDLI